MEVEKEIESNNNESESSMSMAELIQVIKKETMLIDNQNSKKIVFPNKLTPSSKDNDVFQSESVISYDILQKYRKQQKFCDVTLLVGEKKFNVHRIVLAATIPYFHSMFESNMIENNMKEITLHWLDVEVIETFIDYAYGDVISINEHNVEDILVAASFFQIDEIIALCANFFISNYYSSNIVQCYFLADRINCQLMKTEALNYIRQYFSEIVEHESFLELSYDTVKEIISSNNLGVDNESKVFEAIIRWIKHIREERSRHMFSLLSLIRLFSLEPCYLIIRVAKEELVVNDEECRALVDEAKNCLILPERKKFFENFKLQCRSYSFKPLFFSITISRIDSNIIKFISVYNSFNKIWKVLQYDYIENQVFLCVTSDENSLYMVYYTQEEKNKNFIEVYDIASQTSKIISSILHERYRAGAAVLNGFLYLCGGKEPSNLKLSKWQATRTVQRYCLATKTWELLPEMNQARLTPAVVACKGCLYVIGGKATNQNTVNSMEKFNPVTGEWSDFQVLTGKSFAASLHGKIYAIGKKQEKVSDFYVKVNTFDVYDPYTKIWLPLAPLNETEVLSLLSNTNNLWAIGNNFVAVYDTTSNTWSLDRSIPHFINSHYAIV